MSIRERYTNRLSPEYALLGFLHERPSYGYELHQRLLDEFGHIWHASQSQTYNILKRLDAQGYVTSTSMEQEKLPPRLLLYITDSGRHRFDTWLNTPTRSSVHAIRVEFITRLYFIQRSYPQKIPGVIREQAAEVRVGLKKLETTLANIHESQTFDRLGLEMRIRLLNSILGWLIECYKVFAFKNSSGDYHN